MRLLHATRWTLKCSYKRNSCTYFEVFVCLNLCLESRSPLEVEVQHHLTPILTQELTGILVSSGFRTTRTLFSVLSFFWTHQPHVLQALSVPDCPLRLSQFFPSTSITTKMPILSFPGTAASCNRGWSPVNMEELLFPAQGEVDVRLLKLRPTDCPRHSTPSSTDLRGWA